MPSTRKLSIFRLLIAVLGDELSNPDQPGLGEVLMPAPIEIFSRNGGSAEDWLLINPGGSLT